MQNQILKTAYLVMAHKNVQQLLRLIHVLKNPESDVFLHLDNHMDDVDVLEKAGAIITTKRFHGILFDYSLVNIEICLMKTAIEYGETNGIKYNYFCLLSGQDFPLISAIDIQKELNNQYPKAFIDCTPRSTTNWLAHRAEHLALYSFCYPKICDYANKIKTTSIRRMVKFPFYVLDKLLSKRFGVQKQMDRAGLKLYGGSQWWILPDMIVEDILNSIRASDTRYTIIKTIYGPDETFFQSMIMNGPYAKKIEINPSDQVSQNCKTFAFFKKKGFPFVGHPYVFTKEEINLLDSKKSTHYFARKFDTLIDEEVLNWIESNY